MFGLGPMEMMIVLVLGVLLFGKRLPEVGRSLGKGMMEFKKGLNDLKSEVDLNSLTSPTNVRPPQRYAAEEYDEPTAPKFEPPTQAPVAMDVPAASEAKEV